MPTQPFSPSPAQFAQIMRDLTDPFLSFVDITDGASTTIEALSAFLARPDMQERIKDLENNIAARARVVASNALPSAVAAMQLINNAFAREESNEPVTPPPVLPGEVAESARPEGALRKSLQLSEHRRRFAETSRRATSLILRIARFQGGPPPPPRSPRPDGAPRTPHDRDSDTRASGPPAPTKTHGSQSMGPAPADTRAPTPTPDHIDEHSAPLAPPMPPRRTPSLAEDAALLRQLAANAGWHEQPALGAPVVERPLRTEHHTPPTTARHEQPAPGAPEPNEADKVRDELGCPEPEPSKGLPPVQPDIHPTPALDLHELCAPIVFLPITPHTPPPFPITPNSRASRLIATAGTTTPGPAP